MIADYKAHGRRKDIQKAIKELHRKFNPNPLGIPKELCYLTGEYREKYLHDMKICQEYAELNRNTMADIISGVSCAGMRVLKLEEFDYDVGLTEAYDKKGLPLSFLLTAEK